MKLKITEPVLSYEGKPIKDGTREINWRDVIYVALHNFQKDEIPTGEMKAKSYAITTKAYNASEIDLTVNEVAYVLERIDKIYSDPLICGRAKDFFDKK